MIEKFMFWFGEHRKKIGYTLGVLNVLNGVYAINNGQTTNGWLMVFVGSVLIFDAYTLL